MNKPKEAPILKGEDVYNLLPQDDPIQMVDTLWLNNTEKTISGFTIENTNIFVVENEFMEPGIIENIAQTAALRLGYKNIPKEGENFPEPTIGFIGSIKKLKIHKLPSVDDVLRTTIEEGSKIFNITAIHGKSYVNDELIAECEMKIVEKE